MPVQLTHIVGWPRPRTDVTSGVVQVRHEGVGAFKQGCGSDLYIGEYRRCIDEERERFMLPSSNECVICLDTGGDDDTYAVCRLTLHVAPCSLTLHLHAT